MFTKKSNIIYVIAMSLFLITTILSTSMWVHSYGEMFGKILKYVRYFSYFICLIQIIKIDFINRDFVKLIILSACISICSFVSTNKTIFLYIFLFLVSYNMAKDLIIKTYFFVQSGLLAIIIISSQIGINVDYIFGIGERNRHGLGFDWTTTAPVLYFFVILEYIYIRNKSMKFFEFLIIEIISFLLYVMTDARMAFLLSSVSLIFFYIYIHFKTIQLMVKSVEKLYVMVPPFIALFSVYIHWFYQADVRIWNKLNHLLSNRLALGNAAIKRYGIKFWGQRIEWIGFSYKEKSGVYNYVDCSYMQILLEYGMVFLIICIACYSFILYISYKEKNYYLCWCIIFILLFSITEPRLMNLIYNPFPLLAISFLHSDAERELEVYEKSN